MTQTGKLLAIVLIFLPLFLLSGPSLAQTGEGTPNELDVLKQQIADKMSEIEKLEEEINKYKKQIEETGAQATTLKNAIKKLEAQKAKLNADIKLTQKKIETASLNIERLGTSIDDKKDRINRGLRALGAAIKKMDEADLRTPAEIILANENFYDSWNDVETLSRFQGSVTEQLEELKALKKELEDNKRETEKQKKSLTSLKYQLSDQQKIVTQNQKEQNKLLTETKNQESEYRKILADRLAKKEALEIELLDFESQLKVSVDPSLLPKTGSGVLAWPVDSVRITQYFGRTAFATKNPQVYNGMGHNGIDLAASVGTPIKAAADGIVVGTGDTDTQCYGVSYGRWVLIRHSNGLSTLYAHLSLIRVAAGEAISKGEVLGYSGNTGYTTGPHLHLTVYATQAVHISGPTEYKSRVCKSYLIMPVAPRSGYLNPLSYL